MRQDGSKQGRQRPNSQSVKFVSLLLALSILLAEQLPSATCNAAADDGRPLRFSRQHSEAMETRGENGGRNLRHRRLETYATLNTCKDGVTSLHPGDSLSRGEFLCHGTLRFGIDATSGRFVLGFAPAHNETTPAMIAWTAIPTTLFMEKTRPFDVLTLSSDGNLYGYDEHGEEIYDSNYDYYNRLHGKADSSILRISADCGIGNKVGNDNGVRSFNNKNETRAASMMAADDGATCVRLTSPSGTPQEPYGKVTWGVNVHTAKMVAMETLVPRPGLNLEPEPIVVPHPTPAPVESFFNLEYEPVTTPPRPTLRPTRSRTMRPTPAVAVARSPTISPSYANLFAQDKQELPIYSIEPTSIIWGKVWVDSNRNGRVDPYEDNVDNLEVRLFECYDELNANQVVRSMGTDDQGMYFFQVPTGKPYKVHFATAPEMSEFGFSSGEDADADALGWTPCENTRNDRPIQWNAGLYNETAGHIGYQAMPGPEMLPSNLGDTLMADTNPNFARQQTPTTSPVPEPIVSSIGGFLYLDVDESGTMDSKEHAAAVGGYTVNDAVILVSLTDCQSQRVLASIDVEFPGMYFFGNLTQGYYKLGYEMVALARINAADLLPRYSFMEDGSTSTSYETECGKLGKSEVIDDGNVGLRMTPLDILYKMPVGGIVGPHQANLDEMEAMSSPMDNKTSAFADGEEASGEGDGGKSTLVPTLIGLVVTLSALAAVSIAFVKRRGGDLNSAFRFSDGSKAGGRGDARSVRSVQGDMDAALGADQTAIGSLVVEAGKSVAALTAMGGESAIDGGGSGSDEASYTGVEFALKGATVAAGDDGVVGSSPSLESHSHVQEIHEEGSEGYEVYDDEDDEEKSKGQHGDYGPVISNMIAKYSQKKQGGQNADEHPPPERKNQIEQGGSTAVYHQSEAREPRHDGHDNYHASAAAYPGPQENNHDYPAPPTYGGQNQSQSYSHNRPHHQHHQGGKEEDNHDYYQYQDGSGAQHYPQYGSDYHHNHHHQGYHSNDAAAASQQHQQQQPQYDEQASVTSGSSRSSSDPPAASYRDIHTPPNGSRVMVGWDTRVPGPQTAENHVHHEYAAGDQYAAGEYVANDHYAAADQYAATDAAYNGAAYAGDNFDPNNQFMADSDQYMINEDGTYASANYDPNHYAANSSEGAYAAANHCGGHLQSYDEHPQNYDKHQQVESEDSDEDSDSNEDSDSSSSSSQGSSSSSVANSTSEDGRLPSKWSQSSSSAAKTSHAARARRAQSNPRDDRGGWKHQAIPENSTVEYNAYTMPNRSDSGVEASENYGYGEGGVNPMGPTTSDDNKSIHSSGSDQSSDPPGASYKNLHAFPPPPPPRRTTPPRRNVSPNPALPASRRGRSVPPPPPRDYQSPPPRNFPSPPPR
mmetsp:Transcript_4130/g.8770  ORF Transcript_4130/g.8770 Transcript_4130/m.8770 type:complete len:1387 (+) Transcript_4130:243-4403(+)